MLTVSSFFGELYATFPILHVAGLNSPEEAKYYAVSWLFESVLYVMSCFVTLETKWPRIPSWTAKVPHLDAVQLLQTGQRSKRSGVADWHRLGNNMGHRTMQLHKQPEHLPISLVLYKKYWAPCPFFVLESMPWASPRCTHLPESTLSGLLFSQWTTKENIGGSIGEHSKIGCLQNEPLLMNLLFSLKWASSLDNPNILKAFHLQEIVVRKNLALFIRH